MQGVSAGAGGVGGGGGGEGYEINHRKVVPGIY